MEGFQSVFSLFPFLQTSEFPRILKYSSLVFSNWPWFFAFIYVLGFWPIDWISPISLWHLPPLSGRKKKKNQLLLYPQHSHKSSEKKGPFLAVLISQATRPIPLSLTPFLLREVCFPSLTSHWFLNPLYYFQFLAPYWNSCLEDYHLTPPKQMQ